MRARRLAAAMAALVLLGSRFGLDAARAAADPFAPRAGREDVPSADPRRNASSTRRTASSPPTSRTRAPIMSARTPTLPMHSMTYVPLEGVVTTAPASLKTAIVRFQGSDWLKFA